MLPAFSERQFLRVFHTNNVFVGETLIAKLPLLTDRIAANGSKLFSTYLRIFATIVRVCVSDIFKPIVFSFEM